MQPSSRRSKALRQARKLDSDAEAIEAAQKDLDKAGGRQQEDIKAARKALKEAKKKGNDAAEEAARTALQSSP